MIDQQDPRQKVFEMVISIIDRGKGRRIVEICRKHHIHQHFICLGMGTANSEVMDYFGLGEIEKDVVLSMAPKASVTELFDTIGVEMRLSRPGRGVVFSVPLSGLSVSAFHHVMQKNQDAFIKDVEKMDAGKKEAAKAEEQIRHDLILAVINQGHKEDVMTVARGAGATGGTVIHGRNVGLDGMESFLGISIEPEKDVLLIVTKREDKAAIMKAVNQAAGSNTPCQGFIFSLPVNSLAGLS